MTAKRRQQGFTLGETLTALAVVGLSVSLAVPGLQSLARGNGEAAAVNQLVSSLHAARSAAITRNVRVALCPSTAGERCDARDWSEGWISFVDRNGDGDRDPAETVLEQASAPAPFAISSPDYPDALVFGADGRAQAPASGEFAVCGATDTVAGKVIVLRPSGIPALTTTGRDGQPVRCAAAS